MPGRFRGHEVTEDGEVEPLVVGDVVFRAYAVGRSDAPRTLGDNLHLYDSAAAAVAGGSLFGGFAGHAFEVVVIVRAAPGSDGRRAGEAVDRADDPEAVSPPDAGAHDGLPGLRPGEPVGRDPQV